MNASNLSNYQLYQLSKNHKLDKIIRNAADEEIKKRNLSIDELQKLAYLKEAAIKEKPVELPNKYLLMAFPFTWIVHVIVSKKLLSEDSKKDKDAYWIFFVIGCMAWTFIVIFLARIFIVQ